MSRYSTFWRRFFAGIIDGLVFSPITVLAVWLASRADSINPVALAGFHLVTSFIYFAYSIIMHGKYGQTVGKMATNVRVIDVSEKRTITFRQAVLRDIFPVVTTAILIPHDVIQILNGTSYMLNPGAMPDGISLALSYVMMCWGILEVITMLSNRKRRALHDFIAGSVVVRTESIRISSGDINLLVQHSPPQKNSVVMGCAISGGAILVLAAIGGYFAYNKVMEALKSVGLEKPAIGDRPGIVVGNGLFHKTTFVADRRLGNVTDLKWGRFIDADHTVLAAVSSRGVVYYLNDGSPIHNVTFKDRNANVKLVSRGPDERNHFFINQGAWSVSASLIGLDGKTIWRYGESPGVNAMSAGDLNGDGDLEFAVGFNGAGGVHLLNADGQRLWAQPGGNIWQTEIVESEGKGAVIVHSDAGGNLIVRDQHGEIITKTRPPFYISDFSTCAWPLAESKPHCLAARDDVVWLLGLDGSVAAKYDAPDCGDMSEAYGVPFALSPSENEAFAVVASYPNWDLAILYLYDSSQRLLYQEVLAESCQSITTMKDTSNGRDRILVGGKSKIYAFTPNLP